MTTKTPSRSVEASDIVVPVDEQTTIRIRKGLREQLKMISALDGKTIFSITDSVLGDYVQRYEFAIGRRLMSSRVKKTPTK